MSRLVVWSLSLAFAAAQFVTPVPSVMPGWIVPYPGVSAANRHTGNAVESTYTVAKLPHDIVSHFRTLFASAGLPFDPQPMGYGFLIRAMAPECDVEVSIRRRDPATEVRVTCSPRLAATEQMATLHARQRADSLQNDGMKRFDTPVYPQSKAAQPALSWPDWLVRVDGATLAVEKAPGTLKSSFISSPTREGIQAFYADLLAAHNYRVSQRASWIQGTAEPDALGRTLMIWVKIRPSGENFAVELSLQ